jgi:monoamine oxidase
MGFAGGRAATRLERGCDDETSVDAALANLARLTGQTPPRPTNVIVTRWLSDPWARGAYSYNSVYSSNADRKEYARPVGERIYFAGEGTQTTDYGTVQAALRSGVDTARAIFQRWAGVEASMVNVPWEKSDH